MLTFKFMRIAFIVAILLGIAIPLVGSSAVYKRLSSSGDALAHSSLAGVAIGLAAGLNPLLISILTCIVSFFVIELLRKKFNKYSEVGVAGEKSLTSTPKLVLRLSSLPPSVLPVFYLVIPAQVISTPISLVRFF